MKKVFAFAIIGMFFATIVSSCGSTSKGHCDAYGDATTTVEESDVASI